MNPFIKNTPIKNPSQFYGREDEIRYIKDRILANNPQSVSIIGAKKSGKTSLLNYLHNKDTQKHFSSVLFK